MAIRLLRLFFIGFMFVNTLVLQAQTLEAKFDVSTTTICPMDSVAITNLSTKGDGITYTWKKADEAEFTKGYDETKMFRFSTDGTFKIKLTVSDGKQTATAEKTITVYKKPTAKISLPSPSCAPKEFTFTSSSTYSAPITDYVWDLGDGKNYPNTPTASKLYAQGGTPNVTLRIIDKNNCSDVKTEKMTIYNELVASFTVDNQTACSPPLTVKATNTSTPSVDAVYIWEYNDKSAYTGTTIPARTFTEKGDYVLTLKAKNETYGCISQEVSLPISVNNVKAQFTVANQYLTGTAVSIDESTPGTLGVIALTSTSVGSTNVKWVVTGPDGTDIAVSQQKPEATFVACSAGDYKISLTAGRLCPSTIERTISIQDKTLGEIGIIQNGLTVTGNELSTDQFMGRSPVSASQTTWSLNGKASTNGVMQSCTTGLQSITLDAKLAEGCVLKYSRAVKIVDKNIPSIIIKDTTGVVAETTTACTGWFQISASPGVIKAAFTGAFNKDTVTFRTNVCTETKSTINLSAQYSDGCPARTTSRVLTTKYCEKPDFTVFDVNKNKNVTATDVVCVEDKLVVTPKAGLKNTRMNKFFRASKELDATYSTDSVFKLNTYLDRKPVSVSITALQPNGCVDSQFVVFQKPHHLLSFQLESSTVPCQKDFTINLTGKTENMKSISWEYYQGKQLVKEPAVATAVLSKSIKPIEATENRPYAHTARDYGKEVTLIGVDNDGCADTIKNYIPAGMSHAWLYPDKSSGCTDLEVKFETFDDIGLAKVEKLSMWPVYFGTNLDVAGLKQKVDTTKLRVTVDQITAALKKRPIMELALKAVLMGLSYFDMLQEGVKAGVEISKLPDAAAQKLMWNDLIDQLDDMLSYEKQTYNEITQRTIHYGDGTSLVFPQPATKEIDYLFNETTRLTNIPRPEVEVYVGLFGSTLITRNNVYTILDTYLSATTGDDNALEKIRAAYRKDMYPTHTYTKAGIYPVTIVTTDGVCIDTSAAVKIEVGTKLTPAFSFSPNPVCSGSTVTFTTADKDSIDWWRYSSDSAHLQTSCPNAQNQTATVSTRTSGKFDVKLTVGFNGCISEVTQKDALTVTGSSATIDWVMDCSTPYQYTFKPKVFGTTSNLIWNFGDGSPAQTKAWSATNNDVTYNYTKSGDYVVTLKTDNSCINASVDTLHVRKVKAKMTFPHPVLCKGILLTPTINTSEDQNDKYKNMSSFLLYRDGVPQGRVRKYLYGTMPVDQTDYYKFTSYDDSVKLQLFVFDENGCVDSTKLDLRVKTPVVGFNVSRKYLCANNSSINAAATVTDTLHVTCSPRDKELDHWEWSFEEFGGYKAPTFDTTVNLLKNGLENKDTTIFHKYTFAGGEQFPNNPRIYLKVTDIYGCTNTTSQEVAKYKPVSYATFPLNICTSSSLTNNEFKATTSSPSSDVDSVRWYIHSSSSDYVGTKIATGKTTNGDFTAKIANRGTFYATQIAYQDACYDTKTFTTTPFNVEAVDASFTLDDAIVKQTQSVKATQTNTLDAIATNNIWNVESPATKNAPTNSLVQDFTFPQYGTYKITLGVSSNAGCNDTASKTVEVNGAAANPVTGICVNGEISFEALYKKADKVTWDFGDKSATVSASPTEIIKHKYTTRGNYTVTLTSTMAGSDDDVLSLPNYVSVQQVDAKFSIPSKSFCKDPNKSFDAMPINVLDATSGTWTLSNGSSDRPFNPSAPKESFRFLKNEAVLLRLDLASTNGCTSSDTATITIRGPEATMKFSKTDVCKSEPVSFWVEDKKDVERVKWEFETSPVEIEKTDYSFKNTGYSEVFLIVYDKGNCPMAYSEKIHIYEVNADFSLDKTTLCEGDRVQITNTSKNSDTFVWDFGDGSSSSAKDPSSHTYSAASTPSISLSVSDKAHGCKDTKILPIDVKPTPKVSITAKDSICFGDSIHVAVQYDAADKLQLYRDGSSITPSNPALFVEKIEQTALYKADVTSPFNCVNKTEKQVYVQQLPLQAVSPKDTAIIIGQLVTPFVITNYKSRYTWTPTEGLSCSDCPNPVMQPLVPTTYTLTIKDNCFTNTHTIKFDILPKAQFDVPTTFSPNGDSHNDKLYMRGWGVKSLAEFSIYNRWGQKVFTTTNMEEGWDGTYNGEPQPIDNYAFVVRVHTFLNTDEEKKGYVLLAR